MRFKYIKPQEEVVLCANRIIEIGIYDEGPEWLEKTKKEMYGEVMQMMYKYINYENVTSYDIRLEWKRGPFSWADSYLLSLIVTIYNVVLNK